MIGTTISHYRILEELGGGGMGVVYKGHDTVLDRPAALKVISPKLAQDKNAVSGFLREAKAASALNHPNILTVYDLVESEGILFLVTEFVEGGTLRQQIGKKGMDSKAILSVAIEVSEALSAAHNAGIVHRDLKPENIMVRKDRHTKIVDFGLAKLLPARQHLSLDEDSREPTLPIFGAPDTGARPEKEESQVFGTLPYMSPEQISGGGVDRRTDIYSLGVVLYEMTTGRQPHRGETTQEIIEKILTEAPQAIADLSSVVPYRLRDIIAKALEKDPADRYQHMEDLTVDLRRLRREVETGSGVVRRTAPAGVGRPFTPGASLPLIWTISFIAMGLILASVLAFVLVKPRSPKVIRTLPVTRTGHEKLGPIVTDGSRLYFSGVRGGRWSLAQVSASGGETLQIGAQFPNALVLDIAPDGSELLVKSFDISLQAEGPLWILPVVGGSPQRLGNATGHAGSWSPDGRHLAFAQGQDIFRIGRDGSETKKLATLTGIPWDLRYAPDGASIRMTLSDPHLSSRKLVEISSEGGEQRPLLRGWDNSSAECCGNWTPDGKYYVFQSSRDGLSNLWALPEREGFLQSSAEPTQVTSGPVIFTLPVASKDGKKLFAAGTLPQGELARFDDKAGQFFHFMGGISAEGTSFTRDGEYVAYVTYPGGNLVRSHADGSNVLQLSFPPMVAAMPQWSPDNSSIAFMGQLPGKSWKIYVVSADGGRLDPVIPGNSLDENDPTWSPDGREIAFGPLEHSTTDTVNIKGSIQLFDLKTKEIKKLPDSDGLFSPRWSPDGRFIVALELGTGKPLLFDFSTMKWQKLGESPAGWPAWSHDSKSIYYLGGPGKKFAVFRYALVDRKVGQVADLVGIRQANGPLGGWFGLSPDDSPLVLLDISDQGIYALEWEAP